MSRKRKPEPKVSVAKKKPPRWQHEHNVTRFLWIFIPIILVVLLGLIGYWAYDSYIAVWSKPVAKVNAVNIDMNYYVKMLRLYSFTQRISVYQATLPWEVLQLVEENEIIRQEAKELGISVTPEEVTAKIAEVFPAEDQDSPDTVDPTPGPQGNDTTVIDIGNVTSTNGEGNVTPTNGGNETVPATVSPSPTNNGNITEADKEIGEEYYQVLEDIRISDSEYRLIVETGLLSEKIFQYFQDDKVPVSTEHVHLHYIPVDTEETANTVIDRYREGEDFVELAVEFSTDETIKQTGGDVGWVPRGIFPELDDVAFSIEVGNVSSVSTSAGFVVLTVTEPKEDREIVEEFRPVLARSEFENWLQEQKEVSVIEYLDQGKIDWALDHIDWKYENVTWST